MKAAVLHEHGAPPRFDDFEEPVAGDAAVVVEVAAAGVHHLDLAKASGAFYTGPPPLPSVVGSDGVGRLADGRRVFFDETVPPYGSWAERALVMERSVVDVAEGVDDTVAAALGNSGPAAWLALEWRARLQPGETVVVLGAGGAVGNVAVQAAKLLGAGRVLAADRNPQRLERAVERGADAAVVIGDGSDDAELGAALRAAAGDGVDVVVDPLWGMPAAAAMRAARRGARHVQIGHSAGAEATVPAPVVRAAALGILGFAVFHAPVEVRRDAYVRLARHAASGEIMVDVEPVPLSSVGSAWDRQRGGPGTKLVLVP